MGIVVVVVVVVVPAAAIGGHGDLLDSDDSDAPDPSTGSQKVAVAL